MRLLLLFSTLAIYSVIGGLGNVDAAEGQNSRYFNGNGSGFNSGGAFIMPELLLLRPYNTDPDGDSDSDTHEFKEAFRLTIGYVGPTGFGFRGRWLDYDVNTPDADFTMQTVDGELFSTIEMGSRWLGTFSGGARWAEMTETEGDSLEDGYGLIVGAELQYMWSDSIALYSIARHSVLFGDSGNDDDLAVSATELQVGIQGQRALNCGGMVFGRAGVEAQNWNGYTTDDGETFGLFGTVFAVGYQR